MKREDPDPRPPAASTRDALAAQWRGAWPLRASLVVAFGLPVVLLALFVDALACWIEIGGGGLRGAAAMLLLAWPALAAVAVWGGVGAWRAAAAHPERIGAGLRKALARGAIAVAGCTLLVAAAATFVPRLGGYFGLLAGHDPRGRVDAAMSEGGRILRLHGHLGQGDADRVASLLAANPAVYLVELDMPGARHGEALRVADAVRSHRLQTRVVGFCAEACVIVFLAGQERQAMPGAKLGLHRLASGAANPLFELALRRWQASAYGSAGLPPRFVANMQGTSPRAIWRPETDELAEAGLIGVAGLPYDIALPPAPGARGDEYLAALTATPAWRAIDRRYPGSIAEAAARMAAAAAGGADAAAVQVAGQRVVETLLPRLLHDAGEPLRSRYVDLLADQLAAAADPAPCRAVLAGDAAARRALPPALTAGEAAWLAEAARLNPPEPPRPLRPIEREVLGHALSPRAAAELPALRRLAGGDAAVCARARRVLAAVQALLPGERRLAVRALFEGG